MKYLQIEKETLERLLEKAREVNHKSIDVSEYNWFQGRIGLILELLNFGKEIDGDPQKLVTKDQLRELAMRINSEIGWGLCVEQFWKELK